MRSVTGSFAASAAFGGEGSIFTSGGGLTSDVPQGTPSRLVCVNLIAACPLTVNLAGQLGAQAWMLTSDAATPFRLWARLMAMPGLNDRSRASQAQIWQFLT